MEKKKIRDGLKEREDGNLEVVDSDAWLKSFETERKTLKWKLTRPYWITIRIIKETPWEIKYFFQRIFRGYSDRDLWCPSYVIAKKSLLLLKAYRKMERQGTPCGMFDEEYLNSGVCDDEKDKAASDKWDDILDKMIYAMTYVVNDATGEGKYDKFLGIKYEEGSDWKYDNASFNAAYEKYQEGMKLFAEHFMALWD